MSVARYWDEVVETVPRHPNELDFKRIERALKSRKRYRYVEPKVVAQDDGYLIRSACCSRNIDPDGGEIDVALLRWSDSPPGWALYRKDHRRDAWVRDSRFARLNELFDRLNADPDRLFWQ
jgi:hypothetical protein